MSWGLCQTCVPGERHMHVRSCLQSLCDGRVGDTVWEAWRRYIVSLQSWRSTVVERCWNRNWAEHISQICSSKFGVSNLNNIRYWEWRSQRMEPRHMVVVTHNEACDILSRFKNRPNWTLKGEAVGVIMPSLHMSRSHMKNFNPWRPCVSFTLDCNNYFNWVVGGGDGPWSPILSNQLLSQTRWQVFHRASARHKLYPKAPDVGIWFINNSSCLRGKDDTLGWEEMTVPRWGDQTWSSVGTSWPVISGSIPCGLRCVRN